MTELVPGDDVPEDEEALLGYLVHIVEEGRRVAAVQVNATLTVTYWLVGRGPSPSTSSATAALSTDGRFLPQWGRNWANGSVLVSTPRTSAAW